MGYDVTINRSDVQSRAKALGLTSDIVAKINKCSNGTVSKFYNDIESDGRTLTRLKYWFEEVLQAEINYDR